MEKWKIINFHILFIFERKIGGWGKGFVAERRIIAIIEAPNRKKHKIVANNKAKKSIHIKHTLCSINNFMLHKPPLLKALGKKEVKNLDVFVWAWNTPAGMTIATVCDSLCSDDARSP